MKTGFSYGFARKPKNKVYSYHGEIMPCKTEPRLPPYADEDLPINTAQWVLYADILNMQARHTGVVFDAHVFVEDVIPDHCVPVVGTRWAYIRLDFYRLPHSYRPAYWKWRNGNICSWTTYGLVGDYQHWEFSFPVYIGDYYLMEIWQCRTPSRCTVWRSDTGPLPDGIPVSP